MSASQIFVSNRALGYVSNHIPLVTRFIKRRHENLVVTCVGKAFHTYGCAHFSLLSVSIQLEEDITCLGADTYHIYTACGTTVQAWRRGTELKHTYKGHKHNVHLLLPFGPHLISIDEGSNLIVWDVVNEDIYLNLVFSDEDFHITTIVHPSTYLNKILLGSEQGELQLWNIKTSKLIHKFLGWNSPVTVLEQAPAVDVIGIGLADGRILLHNLKFDETVMTFVQDWGMVTTISFRLDGRPIMATGSVSGHIVFWDLERRMVASQLLNAHEASVAGMHFLPNEPLMVTSSPDNTLKMWIFDLSDDGARLLRLREGHAAPPTFIRFHGSNGHNILSSGNDSSLRIFNTQIETFNKSLGRASYNRKASKKKGKHHDNLIMPPITNFDSLTIRDKEWDSIAALHRGLPVVTTWSYDKLKMGDLKLIPDKLKPKNCESYIPPKATCLTITNCGNFVIIGYSTGHLERFNIQSGIHRCSYGTSTAHVGAVRGVVVDSNGQVVASGGADGSVKFWIFKRQGVLQFASVAMEEPVNFFCKHRESSIVCVALDDFSICLLDIDTRKVVRKFLGHTGQINDATFSPDMRWLVSAAMDSVIRVWDIPTGQLVDCFKVPYACISLSFSPTGEYLATAHVDNLGIYLWSNRTLFAQVSLKPLPNNIDIQLLELPSTTQAASNVNDLEDPDETKEYQSPEHLESHLISFSSLANSRWQNLLDLDVIKKRNKPKEAPKAPKAAPFFLPTLPSLNFQFDLRNEEKGNSIVKSVDLSKMIDNHTAFGKLLIECGKCDDFSQALDKLKSMGPSAVDFEVNSLFIEGGSSTLLILFMTFIKFILNSSKDFELGQAYLGLFLKVHGEAVSMSSELSSILAEIQTTQESSWNRLQDRFSYCLSIVDTLKMK